MSVWPGLAFTRLVLVTVVAPSVRLNVLHCPTSNVGVVDKSMTQSVLPLIPTAVHALLAQIYRAETIGLEKHLSRGALGRKHGT